MVRFISRLAALLALFSPSLAWCQSTNTALPPDTAVISPGGVDLVSGQYRNTTRDLAIGSLEAGGIAFDRVSRGAKLFRSNWYIYLKYSARFTKDNLDLPVLTSQRFSIEQSTVAHSYSTGDWITFYSLSLESQGLDKLERFANGSNYYFKHTEADGTYTTFETTSLGTNAYATSISRPNGVVYTLSYDNGGPSSAKRLKRVTSNAGYQLIFEYYSGADSDKISKACALNLAVVTPPTSDSCPGGTQTVSYTYSGERVATITDAAGQVSTIANNFSGSGPFTQTYYKPGQTTPYLTNTLSITDGMSAANGGGLAVTQQVFADGHSFTYSYTNLDPELSDPAIVGGGYGRGTGWIENGTASTSLGWSYRQQFTNGEAGQLFVPPAPETITDPLNRTTVNEFSGAPYTAYQKLIKRTLPNGRAETFTYYNGQLAQRTWTAAPGSGDSPTSISMTYSCTYWVNCAKPITVTDALGNTSDYSYDPTHGGVLTETLPAPSSGAPRPQKRYTYGQYYAWYKNSSGTLVQASSPVWLLSQISECRTAVSGNPASCVGTNDEIKTTFSYGSSGVANNLLPTSKSVIAWDAASNSLITETTSWTYDANGDKLTEDGPMAGTADTTRWRYDSMRRVIGVTSADPDGTDWRPHLATRNTYDAAGRLTKVEKGTVASQSDTDWAAFSASESVETSYDLLDRKLTEAKKSGSTTYALTQFSYDLFGRLECTAVRMNPAAYGSLPSSACTLGTQGSEGPDRITRNYYDAAGQLTKVQQGYGTSVQADYARYEYTVNGLQSAVIDANDNRAEFTYDGHDRRKQWIFPSTTTTGQANASDYEQYGYDANGNRTSLRKRDNRTIAFSFDALNRITAKTYPNGGARAVYYSYDLQGLQTAARYDSASGSDAVLSAWDGFGRLSSSTTSMSGSSRTLSYQYDLANSRIRTYWPDSSFVQYYRDTLERLWYADINNTVPLFHSPTDAQGRTDALYHWVNNSWTWALSTDLGYDAVSRLNSQSHIFTGGSGNVAMGFSYNPASQISSETRDNDDYRFTGFVNVSRGYTVNGLSQYASVGANTFGYDPNGNLTSDGTSSFSYDIENRMTGMSNGAAITYDPLGRLWQVSHPTLGTTQFLHDGDALVAEYDTSGNMLKRYVHGIADGVDDPMVEFVGSGTSSPRYLFADRQGSIMAVADANGYRASLNSYDEYGIPGAANSGRFQYTGQAWLAELGMYYYKARMYSPSLGRFMQTDPIGYDDQINLYAYVNNDPVNNTDPTGEECNSPRGGTTCPTNPAATAATATTTVAAREGVGAERARGQYREATGKLAPNDSAGRSAAKASARAATPPITRGVVEGVRPGLGPKPGSGGTANRTNVGADKLAGRLGTAGRVAGAAGVVVGVARVATSDNPGQEAARVGGGMAGAIAGAEGGATLGAAGGPWGAAAGGVIGGIAGGFLGEKAVDEILDW